MNTSLFSIGYLLSSTGKMSFTPDAVLRHLIVEKLMPYYRTFYFESMKREVA